MRLMDIRFTGKELEILSRLQVGDEWKSDKELEDLIEKYAKNAGVIDIEEFNWRSKSPRVILKVKNLPTAVENLQREYKEDIIDSRNELIFKVEGIIKSLPDNEEGDYCSIQLNQVLSELQVPYEQPIAEIENLVKSVSSALDNFIYGYQTDVNSERKEFVYATNAGAKYSVYINNILQIYPFYKEKLDCIPKDEKPNFSVSDILFINGKYYRVNGSYLLYKSDSDEGSLNFTNYYHGRLVIETKEIPKPELLESASLTLKFTLSRSEKQELLDLLKFNDFRFEIKE